LSEDDMVNERRQYPRCEVSIDGRWLGESGGTTCQVANISLGGCFVRTSAASVQGLGVLRLIFGLTPLTLAGRIVHAERGRGFGVKFLDVSADVRAELKGRLEELKAALVA
jgi:PilZ domain